MLRLGVIGTSNKKNERRIPIHPDHLLRLPEQVRRQLIFEEGYGATLGISDAEIAEQTGGTASRRELLADAGAVVLPKPTLEDLETLRVGGMLWGWPHVVQQKALTQVAIERKQTLIAFEEMFVWGPDGQAGRHTFYKNNELAGYCAVLHALQLRGIDGHYGDQRKTIIFSFGAVSRGPSTRSRRAASGTSPSASNVPTTRCARRCSPAIMSAFGDASRTKRASWWWNTTARSGP